MMPAPASFSPNSRLCAPAKPNRLLETSSTTGWTTLLLDHHEGAGQGASFETHPTDDLTLVVATAGKHVIEAFSGGRWRSATYQPGTAGLTPPGGTARLRWRTPSEQQAFRTVHLYLPGSLIHATIDEYRLIGQPSSADQLSALAFRDETVVFQAMALLAAHRAGAPDLYAACAARWLVTHLLSQQAAWQHIAYDPRLSANITDRRLARVIEFMSAHLDQALTLDALAREAGISVHHFGRRFREATGAGPSAYLTSLRIAHAKLLLRTTDSAVSEVARSCGYPRPDAFATAFRRQVGMTPSAFRQNDRPLSKPL